MANVSEEDVKSGAVAHVLKKVKKEVRYVTCSFVFSLVFRRVIDYALHRKW